VRVRAAIFVLLSAFAAQLFLFARSNAQTYDEGVTLAAGLRILDTRVDDINLEHPPLVKALVALPVRLFAAPRLDVAAWAARRESGFALGQDVLYSGGVPYERLLWLGRAPVMLLALMLVALIGLFAHRLWGPRAGLLALALAAFDPNLVAHGALMGLDLPIALFFTAALFAVNEFFTTRRVVWLALAGLFGGLALATKHSGPLLVAAVVSALFFRAIERGELPAWWDPERAIATRARAIAHAAGNAFLVVGIALLVVRLAVGSAGYAPYLAGLRAQLAHQSHGHPAFLLGEISRTGWTSYFPLALLMKVPPLTLLLALVSIAWRKRGDSLAVVIFPLVCLSVSLLFARINIGVRYALPLVPLLIVLASRAATIPAPDWVRGALAIGVVHHVVAAVRIAPHDLAFFSDAVLGPSRGSRYLADSNLDWGQDISTLGRWLERRERPRRLYLSYFGTADPRAYGVQYRPAPSSCAHLAKWRREPEPDAGRELLAVSAMNLQGVFFADPKAYAWLADQKPIAVLGYSISVYDVTDDVTAHRALLSMYERYGPGELVAEERERVRALEEGAR
jgi:hypothetical protein